MITMSSLSSTDLMKIFKLRQQIEVAEAAISAILSDAEKRQPPLNTQVRHLNLPRRLQPDLRDLVGSILQAAGKPLTVYEIYDATMKTGYVWRSRNPVNALNVKMYTDKTFKVASPGRFVLRDPGRAAKTPKSRSKA